jgi:hypothetical protein
MVMHEEQPQWTGHDLYDVHGDKIGTVADVRYGDMTAGPRWLLVRTGLLGTKKVFVPAGGARHHGDRVVVPFVKDRVKSAPLVANVEVLDEDDEERLCAYYGLEYQSPAARLEGHADTHLH